MKNLIGSFLILFILTIGTQQAFSQMKFGVKGGANFATVMQKFDDSDFEETTKMRVLYSLGAVVDFSLADAISVQPGLLFSAKGYSVDVKEDYEADGYDRFTASYLEIPVNIVYKMKAFQIYAGPYVGIGIFGKNKWDLDWGGGITESGETDIKFVGKEVSPEDFMDEDAISVKRLDYGVNFGLGYEVGPIVVNAGYSMGLANLTPDITDVEFNPDDYKVSHRVISLSVSYFFGN